VNYSHGRFRASFSKSRTRCTFLRLAGTFDNPPTSAQLTRVLRCSTGNRARLDVLLWTLDLLLTRVQSASSDELLDVLNRVSPDNTMQTVLGDEVSDAELYAIMRQARSQVMLVIDGLACCMHSFLSDCL